MEIKLPGLLRGVGVLFEEDAPTFAGPGSCAQAGSAVETMAKAVIVKKREDEMECFIIFTPCSLESCSRN